MSDEALPQSEFILYQTEDGRTRVQCRFENETLWLTQAQIADLFQTTPQNVTLHLKAIFTEGELSETATCKDYLQVRPEGRREVARKLRHYNLDAIIAVGFRVRSHRGTQFRQWAIGRLNEYLLKGFTMDDERLKNPPGKGQKDYFDEQLAQGDDDAGLDHEAGRVPETLRARVVGPRGQDFRRAGDDEGGAGIRPLSGVRGFAAASRGSGFREGGVGIEETAETEETPGTEIMSKGKPTPSSRAKKKTEVSLVRSSAAEYLTFVAAGGNSEVSVEMRYEDENIWLTQKMMAALYDVSVPAINQHLKRIFSDNELEESSVVKQYLGK